MRRAKEVPIALPPLPRDEAERLSAVETLGLVGTPAEERFDAIVRLTRAALQAPYAAVTVIESENVWMKASEGGPEAMLQPRKHSYCSWTILEENATIVRDSMLDERVKDNPWAESFRFYAGVPLRFNGRRVGTLCVGGPEPRELGPDQLRVLRDLGDMVEGEFKTKMLSDAQHGLAQELSSLKLVAAVDGLTKVWSRSSIVELAARALATDSTGFLLIDVDHFKRVNDNFGHQVGDEVLRRVAERIRGAIREKDAVGRYGGEEFLAVLTSCSEQALEAVAERIRENVAKEPIRIGETTIPVTVSVGAAMGKAPECSMELLLKGADEALYRAKELGRDRVEKMRLTPSLLARAATLPPIR